jgi:superfamily II DNA or RNA helicase
MSLRDYQEDALTALDKGYASGLRRLGVSMATGLGKTHCMAHQTRRHVEARDGRVLWLLHRDELVHQSVAKLRATLRAGTSIGVVKAERNEVGARVLVGSVQTFRSARRRQMLPTDVGLVVVDEAHVSVSPTYMRLFEHLGVFGDAGPLVSGWSATWSRSDSTGLGDVWQDVVYDRPVRWGVKHGYLVRPRALQVGHGLDLDDVRVSRATGDYREDDLERAVMLESVRDAVVRGALEHEPHRPSALFAPTVASAEYFGDALREAGLRVAGFYGHTNKIERRRVDAGLRDGSINVVTTCTAIAEGYDNPQLARGLLVRPTRHEGLFVQIFGRFLRPWPGKADALLLDFVGATDDVKLRNAINLDPTVSAPELEDDLLDEELEDSEPVERQRMIKKIRSTHEVDIFAGTPVQWLTSHVGVPFVPCGDELVFMVQGGNGWCVGVCNKRLGPDGRPTGGWVAQDLTAADALQVASDHAEDHGAHLARKSAGWRAGSPSPAQLDLAAKLGIANAHSYSRGALSDDISVALATRVLAPFAHWSNQWKEASNA